MDPLSLVGSLIAVLGAGGSVASGLQKLSSLRKAPDAILALNNEISEFRLVVQMAHDLLQKYGNTAEVDFTGNAETLRLILVRAKERLLVLDMLIQYRLTTPGENGEAELSRIAWAREHRKIKSIQDEIRSIRVNLVAVIGVLTLKASLRTKIQISEFRTISHELRAHNRSPATADQTVDSEARIEGTLSNILVDQKQVGHQSDDHLAACSASCSAEDLTRQCSISSTRQLAPSEAGINHRRHQILSICKRQLSHCDPGCMCRCHCRSTWNSLRHLQSFLRFLIVGYTGFPIAKSCDDMRCRRSERSIGLTYYFSRWFTARVLKLCIRLSHPYGLTQSLRVSRVVYDVPRLFLAVANDDVPGMKSVLSSREGTPYDISHDSGDTALSQAVRLGRTQICRVLLDAGADPYGESSLGITPHDMAWESILGQTREPSTLQAWQTMFPDLDFEGYGFNPLHEAVLGLNSLDLETAYQKCRLKVDEGDSFQNTPLAWAALRGDFKSLEFLIRKGADVNKVNTEGYSPLSRTISLGYHDCTKLLLDHGANVHKSSHLGRTPLHRLAARMKDDPRTVEILVNHQADLNALDYNKSSPLLFATFFKNRKIASKLISLGANIHLENSEGRNALCYAVLRNCHQILTQLLERGADHTSEITAYRWFLHVVAEFADVETLRLLTKAHLAPRDIQRRRRKDGLTALDVAKARPNVSPEWVEAFQDFLQSVNQERQTPTQPSPAISQPHPIDSPDNTKDIFSEALEQQS